MAAMKRNLDSIEGNNKNVNGAVKRRRTYTDADAQLAKLFDALASDEGDARLDAAAELVSICAHEVSKLDTLVLDFDAADFPSPMLSKIFRRLLRGLCSSRKSARMGFFVALTEVLRTILAPVVKNESSIPSVQSTIDFAIAQTRPESPATKQEKKDCQIGRISSLGAFLQSEMLFVSRTPSKEFLGVLESLCGIAKDTSWLREECGLILCEAAKSIARNQCESDYPKAMLEVLSRHSLIKTSEGIALWLEILSSFPEIKMPKKQWHHNDPLSKKELSTVSSILAKGQVPNSAEQQDENGAKVSGARRQAPHFVWDVIIHSLTNIKQNSGSHRSLSFEKFWLQAVDGVYFADTASIERKSLGFQILSKIITVAPAWTIPIALSPQLVKSLMNQSSKSERYLHNAAKTVLKHLVSRTRSDPEAAGPSVGALFHGSGSPEFDKITGTKTVQSILIECKDEKAVYDILRVYRSFISRPMQDDPAKVDAHRQGFANQLVNLIKEHRGKDVSEDAAPGVIGVLELFAEFAYNPNISELNPQFSLKTQQMFQSRLQSCLTHILLLGSPSAIQIPVRVVRMLKTGVNGDDAVKETVSSARKYLEEISSRLRAISVNTAQVSDRQEGAGLGREDQQTAVLQAFELLFAFCIIQAYNGDADAIELLSDVQKSYRDVDQASTKSFSLETIIDIVLDFSSRQSALHRRLAENVFTAFASQINRDELHSLLNVLSHKENSEGQKALFEQDQSATETHGADDSEEGEGSDLEELDDVEIVDAEDLSEEEGASEKSDSEQSDNDDADDEELKRFDNLLASALQTSRSDANDDKDVSDSSDESMDDEQMLALDPQLTAIFRQRAAGPNADTGAEKKTNRRKEQKDAKENVVSFKNRILDLLSIYAKQVPLGENTIEIILPLLVLIGTTQTKQLAEKASGLLSAYFETAKKRQQESKELGSFDTKRQSLLSLLESIHEEALSFPSKAHANACSKASLFVARQIVFSRSEEPEVKDRKAKELEAIVDLYAQTLKRCMSVESGLPAAFWSDWVSWSLSVRGEK